MNNVRFDFILNIIAIVVGLTFAMLSAIDRNTAGVIFGCFCVSINIAFGLYQIGKKDK